MSPLVSPLALMMAAGHLSVASVGAASLGAASTIAAPHGQPVPAGYTFATDADCGYPVCQTIQPRAAGACGIYGPVPCNWTTIAQACDATPGCEGFNSNGWLKACLPPRCPAGSRGMENTTASDLLTKTGPPKPVPPPPPVPDWTDPYYPAEEAAEEAAAAVPTVAAARPSGTRGQCDLVGADGAKATVSVGQLAFGNWTLLAVLPSVNRGHGHGHDSGGPGSRAGADAAPTAAVCVLDRRFTNWSLIVAVAAAPAGEVTRLRKPVGELGAVRSPTYSFPPDYFTRAASDPDDYLGQRILADSPHGEASYVKAAKFLPPIADYVIIGATTAPVKASVSMHGDIRRTDGGNADPPPLDDHSTGGYTHNALESAGGTGGMRGKSAMPSPMMAAAPWTACKTDTDCADRQFCLNSTCASGGAQVFSAEAFLGLPKGTCTEMRTGVLGGHLRVASVACLNPGPPAAGFEMLALGPLASDDDTVLVAVRRYGGPDAPPNAPFTYVEVSLGQRRCWAAPCPSTPERFYGAVVDHALEWERAFNPGMRVTVPYAERRQVDMAKGVIVAASTVWVGNEPNYGTGGDYWRSSPPRASMMDTSGVAGSLPLTSLSLDHALLEWGLFDSALAKIGFYVDTFVFANGTIDMGHWKDIWPDAGQGQYNCTFPDGLSDHGRVIQLFSDAVRTTRDVAWMSAHLPPVLRIGEYLLRSRAEAVAAFPASDPRHGLIYGPAEHDTCDMGMGKSPAVVSGQYMLYYFSVSMWHWRGMVELGSLLRDYPQAHGNQSLAAALLAEAPRLKADIDSAMRASVVLEANGSVAFVPAAVAPEGTKPDVYGSMTESVLASYSNFRYYSEMLGSFEMDVETATALMNFRESNGGMLSGMTRYSDHLDDMPAIGYALSSLSFDRIDKFMLLLYGHAANYQGRGSFFSTEQQSLYQGSPAWRATLGEIQADFCTPSQTLVASMTAMQLVHAERDTGVLWLARAAPRRWYGASDAAAGEGGGFSVENAPSILGNVSFSISPVSAGGAATVTLAADFSQPTGSAPRQPPVVRVRVRDPLGSRVLASAAAAQGDDCVVSVVGRAQDTLDVGLAGGAVASRVVRRCTVAVALK